MFSLANIRLDLSNGSHFVDSILFHVVPPNISFDITITNCVYQRGVILNNYFNKPNDGNREILIRGIRFLNSFGLLVSPLNFFSPKHNGQNLQHSCVINAVRHYRHDLSFFISLDYGTHFYEKYPFASDERERMESFDTSEERLAWFWYEFLPQCIFTDYTWELFKVALDCEANCVTEAVDRLVNKKCPGSKACHKWTEAWTSRLRRCGGTNYSAPITICREHQELKRFERAWCGGDELLSHELCSL